MAKISFNLNVSCRDCTVVPHKELTLFEWLKMTKIPIEYLNNVFKGCILALQRLDNASEMIELIRVPVSCWNKDKIFLEVMLSETDDFPSKKEKFKTEIEIDFKDLKFEYLLEDLVADSLVRGIKKAIKNQINKRNQLTMAITKKLDSM